MTKRSMNIVKSYRTRKIITKFWCRLKNDFCRTRAGNAVCKHNICRNYGSMLKSTLVYLYASMSNQYHTYIFTSKFTSKPPISRRPHIHIPAQIVTGVSQVLIFVLCSFICFSLFTEKSVDLRGPAFPSHRHYRARIWLRVFIRLFIARKFRWLVSCGLH